MIPLIRVVKVTTHPPVQKTTEVSIGCRTGIRNCCPPGRGHQAPRDELFKAIDNTPCDIVNPDMKMPEDRDGIAALQRLKLAYPEKKVMIMSQMCSQELVDEAMSLGADGYITKNDIADMILPF